MDLLVERLLPLLRVRALRVLVAVALAGAYYGLVVAGEIGRVGTEMYALALLPALSLLWCVSRPLTATALSAAGLLLLVWSMTNGVYVQDVTHQSAVLPVVAGGAASARAACRRSAVALAFFAALLAVLFAFVRFAGVDGGAGQGVTLGAGLVVLVLLALATGALVRLLLDHGSRLGSALRVAQVGERTAEREVLLEVERNRIAREVHDVVAHSLAVVIAQADGARFAAETKPQAVVPALDAIADTARRALGEVRTMLHDLRTSGDGAAPGAGDLSDLVDGVRGLDVDVEEASFGEPRPLDRETGLALYRIAQEALTNAVRHGDRTRRVGFEVDWGEREVVLVVTNGVPVGAEPATERAGHGVEGMLARAADAGGDCTAGVGSNGRFRVRVALPVVVPVPERAAEAEPVAHPLVALLGSGAPQGRAS